MVVKQGVWYGSQESDGDEGRHTKSKKTKVESEPNPRKQKQNQKVCSGIFVVIFIYFHIFLIPGLMCNCNIYNAGD